MADVDAVEVLCVQTLLDKDLLVHVVVVLADKHVDVAHDFQHVKALLQGRGGQVDFRQCNVVLLL